MSRESNRSSVVALDDKDGLDRLPEKYREEILKQYDLPDVKVNLFTILEYGTSLDLALQVVGSIMSVAAGISPPPPPGPCRMLTVFRCRGTIFDDPNCEFNKFVCGGGCPGCTWNRLTPLGGGLPPKSVPPVVGVGVYRDFHFCGNLLRDNMLDYYR